MLMESWAIIVLLLMMAGIFSHRKKKIGRASCRERVLHTV